MSDQDLIRRGDALRTIHWLSSSDWTKPERRAADAISEVIAALPAATSDREARLVDALRFYASQDEWDDFRSDAGQEYCGRNTGSKLGDDLGETARALLAELETTK